MSQLLTTQAGIACSCFLCIMLRLCWYKCGDEQQQAICHVLANAGVTHRLQVLLILPLQQHAVLGSAKQSSLKSNEPKWSQSLTSRIFHCAKCNTLDCAECQCMFSCIVQCYALPQVALLCTLITDTGCRLQANVPLTCAQGSALRARHHALPEQELC